MPTKRLLLSIFILLSLVAAACGDDDDGTPSGGDAASVDSGTSDPEPATEPEPAAEPEPEPAAEPEPEPEPAAEPEPEPEPEPAPVPEGPVSALGGHAIDVGTDTPIEVPAGEPMKVAFFIATVSNSYTQSMVDEVNIWGAERDVEVEVFDAQFNSQQQLDQLENVLQNGDFNAWYVTPIDGNLTCNVVTEDAPGQGILVATSNIAICGRDAESAEGQWVPGILSYTGAEETPDYVQGWMRGIAADRAGQDSKIIMMYGPAGITITNNMEAALNATVDANPNLEVVGSAATNFTTADAQAKAETLLQANPDANVIISAFSDMTNGILNAIEDADRAGEIAVYDIGAGTSTVDLIASGAITASAVYCPRTHVRDTLDAMYEAWVNGTVGDRFLPGLCYGTTEEPFFVTADNVGDYVPEY